ncbi:MAG TPA: hypothetical protein PKH24_04270 [Sedimentisphaerales bacterium]|nr:hypothetical protein [Sedimentisphaerales bacterium]HNU29980.1 hypothetical protein [Sedimentisphaerales bacterium]
MGVLGKVWRWWRALWAVDFSSSMEIDSHQWDNKAEILRRLSSSGC